MVTPSPQQVKTKVLLIVALNITKKNPEALRNTEINFTVYTTTEQEIQTESVLSILINGAILQ